MANMFNPYEQQIIGLKEQKALAQKLREQAMEPTQGQMVSGWYVPPSWTQVLAKGVNAYMAGKKEREAEQGIKDVMAKRQQDITGVMQELPQEQTIRPENRPESGMGPVLPAVTKQPTARDYMSWGLRAAQVDPSLGQYGQTMAGMVQHEEAQQEARNARREDLQMRLEDARIGRQERLDAAKELQRMRSEDAAAAAERDRAFRADQAQMNRENQASMARLTASLRPAPAEKTVNVLGPNGESVPVYRSQVTPDMQLWTPSAAKQAQQKATMGIAKEGLSGTLDVLRNQYEVLQRENAIPSERNKWGTNIGAMLSNTTVGQMLGKAGGTTAQTARDTIAQTRPLLLADIKKATGMTASEMNSNAELQMWLATATDPSKGYEANMNALENLERKFGLGRGGVINQAAPAVGSRRDVVPNTMNPPAGGSKNIRVDF